MEYGLDKSAMRVDSFGYFAKTYLDSLNLQIGYFETVSAKIHDIDHREASNKELELLQLSFKELESNDFLYEESLSMNYKTYSDNIALLGVLKDKKELKAIAKEAREEAKWIDKFYEKATKSLMRITKDVKELIKEDKRKRLEQQVIEKAENAKLESIKSHRRRIEKYIGDYEYMAKMFAEGSSMQEATQVLVSAWKRQLASL